MPRLPARDYRIAVPSYQRPDGCGQKTLALLTRRGVDPGRITVYTHAHDPHIDGYRALAEHTGVQLTITDGKGITVQRRRIATDYPAGTPVVSMDDDLRDVVYAPDNKHLVPVPNMDAWLRGMFTDTAAADLHVWGISPVPNAYFLRPGRRSEGLKLLMFTLYGFYSRPGHPVHISTVQYKDEHELSLRAWWYDGGAVRADDVAVKTEYYAPGGCQAAGRSREQVEQSVQRLLAQWPGLVKRNTKRSSDWPEITLTPKKRHAGHPVNTGPPGTR